jgi:hypothetical protein
VLVALAATQVSPMPLWLVAKAAISLLLHDDYFWFLACQMTVEGQATQMKLSQIQSKTAHWCHSIHQGLLWCTRTQALD